MHPQFLEVLSKCVGVKSVFCKFLQSLLICILVLIRYMCHAKSQKILTPSPPPSTMGGEVSTVEHFCFCMWYMVQINQAKYAIVT